MLNGGSGQQQSRDCHTVIGLIGFICALGTNRVTEKVNGKAKVKRKSKYQVSFKFIE